MGQSHSAQPLASCNAGASQQPSTSAAQTVVDEPVDSLPNTPTSHEASHSAPTRKPFHKNALSRLSRRRRSSTDVTTRPPNNSSALNVTQSQRKRWSLLPRKWTNKLRPAQIDGVAQSEPANAAVASSNALPSPLLPSDLSGESGQAISGELSPPGGGEPAESTSRAESDAFQRNSLTVQNADDSAEPDVNQEVQHNDQTITINNNTVLPTHPSRTDNNTPTSARQSIAERVDSSAGASVSERHEVRQSVPGSAEGPDTTETARVLPPSGTLIVVQGILHTSDGSRTLGGSTASGSSSQPNAGLGGAVSSDAQPSASPTLLQPSASNRSSGLISQLLRRRNSATRFQEEDHNDEVDVVPDLRSSVGAPTTGDNLSSRTAITADETSNRTTNDSHASNTSSTTSTPQENRSPLSSHNIDLLGALLSVTTAATAASLLTASHATSANESQRRPPVFPASHPFASPNPLATAAFLHRNRERQSETQSRTQPRSIWDSLRDRISPSRESLQGAGQRSTDSLGSAARTAHNGTEALFNELARAFNIGMDQHGTSTASSSTSLSQATTDVSTSSPSTPAGNDGSQRHQRISSEEQMDDFEQFLMSLQRDLRTAFNQLSRDSTADGGNAPDLPHVADRIGDSAAESSAATTTDEVSETSDSIRRSEEAAMNDSFERSNHSLRNANEFAGNPLANPRHDLPASSGSGTSATASNSRPANNQSSISWWRVHRFAPMRARTERQGDLQHNEGGSERNESLSEASVPTTNITPTAGADDETMIPVIVVGLRSRGLTNTPRPTQGNGSEVTTQQAQNNDPSVSPTPQATSANATTANVPTREDRAPSALGLQTFFIYVFGGFYPPNHRILNNPDSLESFDAVWELMDLLGTARTPLASEEDIERADLEVFKAKSLREFENIGKVSSSNLESCSICLDDYDPEDDLRLLKCKHAFHKACVDQWLKTGKNSCPACRGKGVPVGNPRSATS